MQSPAVEAFGQEQLVENTRRAQAVTERILADIAAGLVPGVTESQLFARAEDVFQSYEAVKRWHVPFIRIGDHTAQSIYIGTRPDPENVLREEDIAFIDIGPVIEVDGQEIEGDLGRTYVLGENPLYLELKTQAKHLFAAGVTFWRAHQPSGVALYQHLDQLTQTAGFAWNLPEAGHLIGSFPHSKNNPWPNGLINYPHTPQTGLWILEVQIKHPELPYGAFYEDLLI